MSEPQFRPASVLVVPASSPDKLLRSPSRMADEIMVDLEDTVHPEFKVAARKEAIQALPQLRPRPESSVAVRVNALGSPWFIDDVTALHASPAPFDRLIVPKVRSADDVRFIHRLLEEFDGAATDQPAFSSLGLVIETPEAVNSLDEILRASDRVDWLLLGAGDLGRELGLRVVTVGDDSGDARDPWYWVRMRMVLSARVHNMIVVDGPFSRIHELESLRKSCLSSRNIGFDGRLALHPAQIPVINDVFSIAVSEYDDARAVLDALDARDDDLSRGAFWVGDFSVDEAVIKVARDVVSAYERQQDLRG